MEEALHQAHPGRQCRSVSFDDGSRRVIATDLDPEVDPRMLKPTTGRVPTPRPSKTECNAREADDSCDSSPSRPESSTSRGSVSSAASESAPKDPGQLNPELLMMRLTLGCAAALAADLSDKEPVLRERGEGVQLPDNPRLPEKQEPKVLEENVSNGNLVTD
ncbi:uncharacterized protein LOC121048138 [Ixodes scapularis]|uniref:uncharacterized protein LOC121048138 n=1 Tax=Ixodes scapularis TaxID=6945 RepID=UPI001AD7DD4C|nr:uncharacterized protein LOC121048138 [Ixodes scapularis]